MEGDDTIIATGGVNFLFGNGGNDTITGGIGEDRIFGGTGDDVVHGGAGNDFIVGDAGDDQIFGEVGNDVLAGAFDDDRLDGGVGNDFLFGNDGNDRLVGGLGSDRLFGLAGNDVLAGGPGRDLLRGGQGNDLDDRHNEDFAGDAEMHGLIANLTVPPNSTGSATGTVRFEPGQSTDDGNFRIQVSGLTANATFTIKFPDSTNSLNQTLTTGANGAATLNIFDPSLNITPGQTIQILDKNGNVVLRGIFDPDGDTKEL